MRLMFWQQPGPRKLSGNLRDALAEQFKIPEAEAAGMLSVEKSGTANRRSVKMVRIFDAGTAGIRNYDDLDSGAAGRGGLLFEGHLEKTSDRTFAVLADRRARGA